MVKLPRKIKLSAMKQQWKVAYIGTSGKLIIIEHPHKKLALYGGKHTKLATFSLLSRWVRLRAGIYLMSLVRQLNRRVKANYKKISIRSHTAQWGSCSPKKTISLDYKLIFLPQSLVKHLILHELCHIKHFNHSDRFWKELKKYDKHYKRNDVLLNSADIHIPEWVVL